MNKIFFTIIWCLILLQSNGIFADPGDSTVIQVFTFGSPRDAVISFPDDGSSYEKILMYYTLKCVPGGAGGLQYPCGEWDYLTYTFLYHPTGTYDSTLLEHPNFLVNNNPLDSFDFTLNPSWDVFQKEQDNIVYDNIISENIAEIGSGNSIDNSPFGASKKVTRSQYIWLASELLSNGLSAGDITGMRFNVENAGAELENLKIAMKQVMIDDLAQDSFENQNLETVFYKNTSFNPSAWNSLNFTAPFEWDGTSNILVEISYSNTNSGQDNSVKSTQTTNISGIQSSGADNYLSFNGPDFIKFDDASTIFSDVEDQITVSFWVNGDPVVQAQNDYIFEAADAQNRRVVNVHLPWSNGRVYWDAGNSGTGSYDRIDKAAQTMDYEGQWNHWAFTKNANTGEMKIYLNGVLWHSGTEKSRSMAGIEKFVIGSSKNNTGNYDGFIDEFRVWNTELDESTIADWMLKDLDASHPNYDDLILYLPFNEEDGYSVNDISPTGVEGKFIGIPQRKSFEGNEVFKNISSTNLRPNVQFVQGIYDSHIETTILLDSILREASSLQLFEDFENPYIQTDLLYVWEEGYSYLFDVDGNAIDSTLNTAQNTINQIITQYYSEPFEVIDRFELGRYITPYGINLDLGEDGFTWVYDVSDYAPVLKGDKRITAGNWQELLDLKFVFYEGTPPRDIVSIQNVYDGKGYNYNTSEIINNNLEEKSFELSDEVEMAKLKIRTTGHGFGGTLNCSEFCSRDNKVFVNGTLTFIQELWRDNCAANPLYPQGGTWIYDRANWCPGAEVTTDEYDLTPFLIEGQPLTLQYQFEDNYVWNGGGSTPYYRIETQLVSYGEPNFTNDARIEEILAPNKEKYYLRNNPICGSPEIRIRNTGSENLTSLKIRYGIVGGATDTYTWSGNLNFMEDKKVNLPPFNNNGQWSATTQIFFAEIIDNNDEYEFNNYMESEFELTPDYEPYDYYVFNLLTNNAAHETSNTLKDENGNIIESGSGYFNNTLYSDTIYLDNGCYSFQIQDTGDDGLSFWNNNDGSGYALLKGVKTSPIVYSELIYDFPVDFGSEVTFNFTIGGVNTDTEEVDEKQPIIELFPNPTEGIINFKIQMPYSQDVKLNIYDIIGNRIFYQEHEKVSLELLSMDLSNLSPGVYNCSIETEQGIFTERIIISK